MGKSAILATWMKDKKHIYIYTVTVRLNGKISHIADDHLVLDDRTMINYHNIVSISDVEQNEKPKKSGYNF